jgi:uncharacterized protein (TIGR00251 family)
VGEESELRLGKVLPNDVAEKVQLGAVRKSGTRVHPSMTLIETRDGTIIEIFVKPKQPDFRVTIDGDEIIVYSTEEPAKGRVNKELMRKLSRVFHSEVEVVSGFTSRQKRLLLRGVAKSEAERILRSEH